MIDSTHVIATKRPRKKSEKSFNPGSHHAFLGLESDGAGGGSEGVCDVGTDEGRTGVNFWGRGNRGPGPSRKTSPAASVATNFDSKELPPQLSH